VSGTGIIAARLEAMRSGRDTAVAAVQRSLAAIRRGESGNRPLHAFLALDEAGALRRAGEVDAGSRSGPLAGVTVAVKDNICTTRMATTCGSRFLEGYRSPYDATVIRRLQDAGAVVVGKTNLDEFAMGSSTENSGFGPTLNPHDFSRVPGGSSGGSAAAVAAGVVDVALGSETGGSVRQPAAFCGVVGVKPTYGRVSRYGLVAFASSLDQIGTLGRTVEDAARVLQVISGPDPLDSTCPAVDVPDLGLAVAQGLDGLVVGVPNEYLPDELDGSVRALFQDAVHRLRDAGARVRSVSLPHTRYAIPTYYIIAPAEASSNLARYDGVRYGVRPGVESTLAVYREARLRGFGAEVKRRIMLGTYVLSAGYHERYYGRAQQVRALIARDFQRVFEAGVDVIFTPTTPTPAFPFGERTRDPYAMYLADIFTVTANLAGIPGLSLPIGRADGLPIGGQFLARRWAEPTLIRAAAGLERRLNAA
jgi:aspartyl-tRNA(Asn)/glutamyl-tRNA(Gln) amidotransferase subunit A